jgi:phosphatidylinositol glycan class K
MYQRLRQNGIPSSNIVMMMADEIPSNARNPFKNGMFDQGIHRPSLYDHETSIAYRGADVTVANFFNVLLGTVDTVPTPHSRVLHTNSSSNILVYVTGHGGDQFFKFQDEEELMADDIAEVFEQMHLRQKYNQVLFIADTCQAFTLADKISIASPNVYAMGTSLRGENAYAHHSDRDVGLSVIERWTFQMLKAYDQKAWSGSTLQEILITAMEPAYETLGAHLGVREDLGLPPRTLDAVLASEFFGGKNAAAAAAGNTKTKTAQPLVAVSTTSTSTIMRPPRSEYQKEERTTTMAPSLETTVTKAPPRSTTTGEDDALLHPLSQEFGMLAAGFMVLVLLTSLLVSKPLSETTAPNDDDDADDAPTSSLSQTTKEKKL